MKNNKLPQHLKALIHEVPENTKQILQIALFSLGSALTAVAFLLLTHAIFEWTFGYYATQSPLFFLVASFLTIMGSSILVGLLLQYISPQAAGSGIPQVKIAYWKELGYFPIKPLIVKFVTGVLSIGGGTSLGREGPTVFMGASMASNLAGLTGAPKRRRRDSTVIGASAGLAAAFNTPLASITFVLEEIVGDVSSRSIGKVVLSSVIGAFVVYALVGSQPAFILPPIQEVTWLHYVIVPVVALVASLIGVVFQRSILSLKGRLKGQKVLPPWLIPAVGAFITWFVGSAIFLSTGKLGVFGLGYDDLSSVLQNDYVWWVAGIMVVTKLIATVASYAFGGSGGIFSPLLFIGGMTGFFIAGLLNHWLPLSASDLIVLSVVGMSSCLGTVLKAPLSSLLIVFEMTHQFTLVPGLLIGMFISMLVSRIAGPENLYDSLLVQDGHELHRIRPPRDLYSWQNLSIGAISNAKPIILQSFDPKEMEKILNWPYNRFPVWLDGKLAGVASREELQKSLKENRRPNLEQAVCCYPEQTVSQVSDKFITSPARAIVVINPDESVCGIITLHDLLRAQASFSD